MTFNGFLLGTVRGLNSYNIVIIGIEIVRDEMIQGQLKNFELLSKYRGEKK